MSSYIYTLGRYNLCPAVRFCATPPIDGNLRRYYTHDANMCYKLPSNVSLEQGALLEPLAVGVHACNKAHISVGDTVLVCGAGPIGCACVLVAEAAGATEIVVTDVSQFRLDFIKSLGATHAINVQDKSSDALISEIQNALGGTRPNRVLECSGAETSVQNAIKVAKAGGVIVLVGLGAPVLATALGHVTVAELTITGSFRYGPGDYARALSLVASGRVDVGKLVSRRFALEEAKEAFEFGGMGSETTVKVMIDV
ncbi:hypothetical protein HK104_000330 [Borealophlyctis nickersoniae]|nr:hypothetical protein HK104_000330 [Borealophlyctis nickersoniae]